MKAAKIPPRKNNFVLRGMQDALAMVGVIPNAAIALAPKVPTPFIAIVEAGHGLRTETSVAALVHA